MKARILRKSLIITLGIYLALLLALEGIGQLTIQYLESKGPTGLFGEEILSHNEPVLGFGLKKNLKKTLGYWKIETNSLGFRESEFPAEKPKDEFRIFLVGGSTMFGWGATDNATIPRMLEQRIAQHLSDHNIATEKKIRIINAGIPWYSSWQESALIFFRILPLNPDWIISFNGLNDVANAILPEWAPIHEGYVDTPTLIASEKRNTPVSKRPFWLQVCQISPSFRYFYAKYHARKQLNTGVYRPEIWTQYSNYMTWITNLTKTLGIRFSVFLQPVIAVDYTPLPGEIAGNASSLKLPEFASAFRRTYLNGVNLLKETRAFRFHSLHSLFKNTKRWTYIDGLHYTGEANYDIMIAIFENEIRPNIARLLEKSVSPLL